MTDIDRHTPPIAAALSQGTTIEQSRAVAQVQAMVIVAQQVPRSMERVVAMMRESCAQPSLAEKAFFRFPRGKEMVTGPTIHLARELARCYRNMDYGVTELSRDDDAGRSEMLAYAYDLEANTRAAQIFIVPHMRDTKTGRVALPDLRDIYEHTTNQAARRLREQIWAVLPGWFIREAEDRCRATLEDGGGKSLAQRVADGLAAFEGIGVGLGRLEARTGKRAGEWTAFDLAQLQITFRAIRNGETTIAQEFPDERVTVADILPPDPHRRRVTLADTDTPPDPPTDAAIIHVGKDYGAPAGGARVPTSAVANTTVNLPSGWTSEERQAFLIDVDQASDSGDLELLQTLEATAIGAHETDMAREAGTAIRTLTDGRSQHGPAQ